MTDSQTNLAWDVLLDLSGSGSLHRQLVVALRSAITSGRLAEGMALPPSRTLATTLGCSRWSVTEAYSQLVAEGYLDARTGSATRVRWTPDRSAPTGSTRIAAEPAARWDLAPGLPDLRAFPRRRWADAVRRATSAASDADLGFPDVRGNPTLRAVLAGYLGRVRGVELIGAEVIVTTSATAGVGVVSRVLAADGITAIGVEDPGWTRLHAPMRAAGLDIVAIGVDDDGLRVEELERHHDVRAVVVTPAHQFPRGVVLAPHRRAALLDWARQVSGVVVEDDYDAEFRYDGRAVGALQGMDRGRVFLAGSVSKTMSPAVGIGWLVVPGPWLSAVAEQLARPTPPTLDQLAFADLVTTGGYDRHLRSRRQAFRRRRTALVEALANRLPDCPISGLAAGLHLTLALPDGVDTAQVVARAGRRGVHVVDAASYRIGSHRQPPSLVIGYGNLADSAVDEAVAELAAAVPE
ncbi:MAG TPA: PLP-dependent aminotransferase family protein [Nocardioidaceae bacterium]|nr:PLP-dependent aminotransferase family protein [Nocardioidaceae bacterium]